MDNSSIYSNKWNVNFVSIYNNQSEVQSSNYYSNKTKALKVKVGADYITILLTRLTIRTLNNSQCEDH